MTTQKAVRSDSLKVMSFAMTHCTKAHAIDFINKGGLSVIFGFLMRQDPTKNKRSLKRQTVEDVQQDEEHCLSIIWNLIVALETDASNSVNEKICLERLCFKLIEGRFDKFEKLVKIHVRQFSLVSEFDLADFKTAEEIGYLEADFGLDMLALVDCIVAYVLQSDTCKRLMGD